MKEKTKKSLKLFWLKQLCKICPGARLVIPVSDNGLKKYSFDKLEVAEAIVKVGKKE